MEIGQFEYRCHQRWRWRLPEVLLAVMAMAFLVN